MASPSGTSTAVEVPKDPRNSSNASSGMDSDTGRLSEVPKNPRKSSNASSGMESDMLHSLGSVGSGLADLPAPILDLPRPDETDDNQFQVPASVPQHQLKLPVDDASLHVSFTRLQHPLEENASFTSSKGSRNLLPERRLPTKKRKMSYESYDSAMGDSYLGLASLDSGIVPRHQADGESLNTKGSGASSSVHLSGPKMSALDHLDALGDDRLPAPAPVLPQKLGEGDPAIELGGTDDNNSEATFTSSGHRLLMEAIMMTTGGAGGLDTGGRKRLESWGGMSDLSVHVGPDQGVNAAAALAASALHHTGIFDDVTAAANLEGSVASSVTEEPQTKPSATETLPIGRERKESTTSFSDSTFPVPSSLDGLEVSSDLQKFVAAAVASVGDQLAELAGNVESAAAAVDVDNVTGQGSEVSSIATPLVSGILLDDPSHITVSGQSSAQIDTSTSLDVRAAAASAATIAVDYDAVQAAVDAANAATGGLDLSAIMGESGSVSSGRSKKWPKKRKLPMNGTAKTATSNHLSLLGDVPKSSLSEKEQEEIRERARKAAGYVPPSHLPNGAVATPAKNRTLPPLKKRMKRATPEPFTSKSSTMVTPKISNATSKLTDKPSTATKSKAAGSAAKSTQKWDSMYDCLIQFVADRKKEETAGLTEEEEVDWTWDGNVPTTYKTKDGKALGRWINNQRSAKSKGTLREEREKRLVGAGLKWSVLASNSWNEMLEELRIYIKEFTKDGRKWDGNVPTNYRIKARANGKKMSDEDKNLGRWVNRQRSLYQAGKLREDRQKALEKVGLKWSMLATTSWEAMFETLVAYVEEKNKKGISWDGNVPANYRTDDNPPRALGRWINRQRSAHVKKKLKQEYVDKLSQMGLKWSVHERKYIDEPHDLAPVKSSRITTGADTGFGREPAQVPSTIAVPAKKLEQHQPPIRNENDLVEPEKVPSVRFDDCGHKSLPQHTEKAAETATGAPAIQSAVPVSGESTPAAKIVPRLVRDKPESGSSNTNLKEELSGAKVADTTSTSLAVAHSLSIPDETKASTAGMGEVADAKATPDFVASGNESHSKTDATVDAAPKQVINTDSPSIPRCCAKLEQAKADPGHTEGPKVTKAEEEVECTQRSDQSKPPSTSLEISSTAKSGSGDSIVKTCPSEVPLLKKENENGTTDLLEQKGDGGGAAINGNEATLAKLAAVIREPCAMEADETRVDEVVIVDQSSKGESSESTEAASSAALEVDRKSIEVRAVTDVVDGAKHVPPVLSSKDMSKIGANPHCNETKKEASPIHPSEEKSKTSTGTQLSEDAADKQGPLMKCSENKTSQKNENAIDKEETAIEGVGTGAIDTRKQETKL